MKKIIALVFAFTLVWTVSAQGILDRNLSRRQNLANSNPAPTVNPAASGTGRNSSNPSDPGASKIDPGRRSIEFNGASLDIVLLVYGNFVNKTVLKDPAVPAVSITLHPKQDQDLTDADKVLAIETVLEMNGVHLEPYGDDDKFMRAIPRGNAHKDVIPLLMDPDVELGNTTKVVSLMLAFNNIPLEEAQKALEGLKSDKGVLNVFERIHSILITDTELNVRRMREIARKIDVSTPSTENVFVVPIRKAAASDIQKILQEIIEDSKKILEKQGNKQGSSQPQNYRGNFQPFQPRPGMNRPGGPQGNNQPAPAASANESLVTSLSDADRGIIRGETLVIADERTNQLIIKTMKTNMDFFNKIIAELDIDTQADTVTKLYRLKYANAEDVSDMINDLIGNSQSSKSSQKGNQNAATANSSGPSTRSNLTTGTTTSQRNSSAGKAGDNKVGALTKENTTVLADKRVNGVLVQTQKDLVPVIKSLIEEMDIKLSQVLIETCIIEVTLGDDLKTGIDWVQKEWTGNDPAGLAGGGGGTGATVLNAMQNKKSYPDWVKEAKSALGSDSSSKLSDVEIDNYIKNAMSFSGNVSPIGAGINYLIKSDRLNLSAVISAAKSDSRAKYLASPVVMTVDNKEATIEATESRKFYSGSTTSSGSYNSNVSYNYTDKDLGIKIKVTPKINPNGTVMLQVEEEYSQIGAGQSMLVSTNTGAPSRENVDTALTRKMSADVILENRQTVVLGGLTEKLTVEKESGIPILKDIPWIGKWLFGSVEQTESRKELLVFMTPYVINDADEAEKKAEQLKKSMSEAKPWDDNGWSESKLADPVSETEKLRRQRREWKNQDEEYAAEKAIEEAKLERANQLLERMKEEEESRKRKEEEK